MLRIDIASQNPDQVVVSCRRETPVAGSLPLHSHAAEIARLGGVVSPAVHTTLFKETVYALATNVSFSIRRSNGATGPCRIGQSGCYAICRSG